MRGSVTWEALTGMRTSSLPTDKEKHSNEIWLDAIRGSLYGGAAGDALGYPIEFMDYEQIKGIYGKDGILSYQYDSSSGKALLSDDTQMTLFTVTGLLLGITRGRMRGIMGSLEHYVWRSYRNWCELQCGIIPKDRFSWLCDVPEMGETRASGMTCMSSIMGGREGTIFEPINHSKGCGGIMRVAPAGLYLNRSPKIQDNIRAVDELAAAIAALTHGHELGYMPAAALAHIINRITYGGCSQDAVLEDIVLETMEAMGRMYAGRQHLQELCVVVEKAIELSHNQEEDIRNIQELGWGFVAEETLAIAIYCCLKYQDDFSKALCVSVNHSGDSDSTGAVTGNILGALWGYERIPSQWKTNLECGGIILELADDLCYDCLMTEYGDYEDPAWVSKYIECRKYKL